MRVTVTKRRQKWERDVIQYACSSRAMCSSSISWTRGLVSPFVFLSCKGAAVTERSDIDDESGPLFGIGQPPRWRLASHHVLGMATVSPTHRYRGVHTSSAEVRVASKGRHRMDADDDRSALMNPSPASAVSLFSDSSSFPFWFCFVLFCFFVVSLFRGIVRRGPRAMVRSPLDPNQWLGLVGPTPNGPLGVSFRRRRRSILKPGLGPAVKR